LHCIISIITLNIYYNNYSLLIYSAIVLPYKLAFVDEDDEAQKIWDTMTDGIFFIDLVLSFFSAYYDGDENLIKSLKVMNMINIISIIDFSCLLLFIYLI